jgi:hypothetical protein
MQSGEQGRWDHAHTSPPRLRTSPTTAIKEDGVYEGRALPDVVHVRRLRSSPPQRIPTTLLRSQTETLATDEQENIPLQRLASKGLDRPSTSRPAIQPLRPAQAVASSVSPPEVQRHRHDPSLYDQQRATTEARLIPVPAEQSGIVDYAQHARTAPAPPIAHASLSNGKRSYIVSRFLLGDQRIALIEPRSTAPPTSALAFWGKEAHRRCIPLFVPQRGLSML